MKICLAQTQSLPGNFEKNRLSHKIFIRKAAAQKADAIFFSELSLTGYEPTKAKSLAKPLKDNAFDSFQDLSDAHSITIGLGMPILENNHVYIGMLFFQPHKSRQCIYKQFLHKDETPFFTAGNTNSFICINETPVALAICYEITVESHRRQQFASGAKLYIASVAKTDKNIKAAHELMQQVASKQKVTVLLVNSIGSADGEICSGESSVWDSTGALLYCASATQEGLVLYDTDKAVVQVFT